MTGLVSIDSVSQRSASVYGRSWIDGLGDDIRATIPARGVSYGGLRMTTQRFPIRLGARSRPLLRLFGVGGSADAWVELQDAGLEARFGWSQAATSTPNITGYRIEGPWLWITAIGVRRSVRHGDITFGGSPHGGVRIDFRERVPIGPFRVPALYVTVDDLEGFASALAEHGIAGVDARTRIVP